MSEAGVPNQIAMFSVSSNAVRDSGTTAPALRHSPRPDGTGLHSPRPGGTASQWPELDAARWSVQRLVVDASLGAARPAHAAMSLAQQLGVALVWCEDLRHAPLFASDGFVDSADWGVDFEAGGERAIQQAWEFTRQLLPHIHAPVAVLEPRLERDWDPADRALLRFLSECLGPEQIGLLPETVCAIATETCDPLLACVPGVIDADILAALGTSTRGLVPLSRGSWLVPPSLRARAHADGSTLDWLAIRAARLPWLAVHAQLHSSAAVVRPAEVAAEAESCYRRGYTALALRRLERLVDTATSPWHHALWLVRLQGVRIGRLLFEAANAQDLPADCPPQMRGFLTLTQAWGKVMTGAAAQADVLFAEARQLLEAYRGRPEYLYVLNISALARARLGDIATAEAMELEIEAELQQLVPRRHALEYINAINLHRLYRMKQDRGRARHYLTLAEQGNAGTRTRNDALYTVSNLWRMAQSEGDATEVRAQALSCAALFLADPVPEALASRTVAGLLGQPWPLRQPWTPDLLAEVLVQRLTVLFPEAGGAEQDTQDLSVCWSQDAARGMLAEQLGTRGMALLVETVGVIALPCVARMLRSPSESRRRLQQRLARILLAAMPAMSAEELRAADHWTLVIDDRGGRGLPRREAELLAVALRLGVGRSLGDGQIRRLDAHARATLQRHLLVALSPGIAHIEADRAVFRRIRSPLPLTPEQAPALRPLTHASVAVPAQSGLSLAQWRLLEASGVVVLDLPASLINPQGSDTGRTDGKHASSGTEVKHLSGGPDASPLAERRQHDGDTLPTLLDQALGDPAHYADPYPLLARLRAHCPVATSTALQGKLVTAHALVLQALKDPRLRASRTGDGEDTLSRLIRNWIIFMDPPRQRQRRTLMARLLADHLAVLHPQLDLFAQQHIARLVAAGGGDFMATVAQPLTLAIIGELLGVPSHQRAIMGQLCTVIGPVLGRRPATEAENTRTKQQVADLVELMRRLVRERKRVPAGDLLSDLAVALPEEDAVADAILLLFGGQDTSANLMGSVVARLVQRPEERAFLPRDVASAALVVEEYLRLENSVQTVSRRVEDAMQLGGCQLVPGERVMLSLAAANRDPAVFPEPDCFDPRRRARQQITFGGGAHLCLGAALARLELSALLRHLPPPAEGQWWRLQQPVRYVPSITLRGPLQLLVDCPPSTQVRP
jgi:cytochrome P450